MITLPEEYKSCPNCKSDWKPHPNFNFPYRYICNQCYLNIYLGDYVNILWFNFDKDFNLDRTDNGYSFYFLNWEINNNICKFGNIVDTSAICLPWLPFNITPDKLKTYLLFI